MAPGQKCSWIQRNAFGCTSRFDFSLRFEHLILSILPSAIFLIAIFWRALVLSKSSIKTQRTTWRVIKLTTATLYASIQIALLILWSHDPRDSGPSIAASALSLILAVGILGLTVLEHDRSTRPSSVILAYLLLSTLFDVAQLRTILLVGSRTAISGALSMAIALKLLLQVLEARSKVRLLNGPYKHLSPEAVSSVISRALFWWTSPLFYAGYRRLLSPIDLYPVDAGLQSTLLGDRLNDHITSSDITRRHAFLRACLGCFKRDIALMVPARLAIICFTYSQTFLLGRAVGLLSEPTSVETENIGYALIGASFFIYMGIAISTALYQRRVGRTMVKLRGAIVASVFSRALIAADGVDTGNAAITLMSTDVDTITRVFSEMNETWARLVEVIIGIALLSRQVGAISIVPIALAVLSTQAQTWVSKRIGNRRKLWNEATQKRVGTTASVLGAIQSVRISGLMKTTTEHLQTLRIVELRFASAFLKFVVGLNAIAVIPMIWAPVFTWIIYAIKARLSNEEEIDTAQAFTSLALLFLITTPTAKLLTIMPLWAQASACFVRLQKYFSLPTYVDHRDRISGNDSPSLPTARTQDECDIALSTLSPQSDGVIVFFDNVTILSTTSRTPLIDNGSFKASKGTISAIIGPPGSGKSTLLKALLGEVACTGGRVSSATKSIAYCGQSPWITDTTVAEFIKGPNGMNDDLWYQQVIRACDLTQDLRNQPEGDNTQIGSRGITLSGGQRARLALARAVYARRDVLLLDDILSAVDARTEATIVKSLASPESPFRNGKRTIVAVSHSTKLIEIADKVYRLSDAKLTEIDRTLGSRLANIQDTIEASQSQEEEVQPRKAVNPLIKPPSPEQKQDMTRQTGDWSIYQYYFRTTSANLFILFVVFSVGIAFCSSFTQVWLQWWTESGSANNTLYLTVFAGLACGSMFFTSANMVVVFLKIMPTSAARLHRILLETVARSPYSLFYAVDTGTILNKFSQDMSLVCNALATSLISTGNTLCETIASLVLISVGASYMGLTIPLVLAAIYIVQKIYLKTSRQLRYFDLERRSPLYSHFLETLEGLVTIRSFGWSEHTEKTNRQLLDESQAPLYLLYCVQRWLRLVLDLTTMALAVVVVALALSMRHTTSAGRLGLALTNILSFSQSLSRLITEWTTMETSIGSVARIRSFAAENDCATHSERRQIDTTTLGPRWPSGGSITLNRVYAKYATNDVQDRPCLEDVSLQIHPGQKVSVCGRTGSGKTSLMLAIFQVLPLSSGQILIDGIDITTLSQDFLQKSLIGVPQQAFIMPASVRYNLDPAGEFSDDLLLRVLSRVALLDLINERGGLDALLDQSSLSQGQQQLFCLARALCRKTDGGKIVVLDEATSNLDPETHQLVSELITSEFNDYTIVTIAHRVDTILSSDVAVFMDQARLVGFGPPNRMLEENAKFRELCQQ